VVLPRMEVRVACIHNYLVVGGQSLVVHIQSDAVVERGCISTLKAVDEDTTWIGQLRLCITDNKLELPRDGIAFRITAEVAWTLDHDGLLETSGAFGGPTPR